MIRRGIRPEEKYDGNRGRKNNIQGRKRREEATDERKKEREEERKKERKRVRKKERKKESR